jgi:hypothetical protein
MSAAMLVLSRSGELNIDLNTNVIDRNNLLMPKYITSMTP